MNRTECEQKLEALMREIWETYKQYNPDGEYFTMTFIDGRISANNSYWDYDAEKPINFIKEIRKEVIE